MGGPVRIGVRYKDNTKYCGLCWTGNITVLFQSKEFYENDLFFIAEYLHTASETYDGLIFPEGYGLVFADMENKVIYSMQGYTIPCRYHAIGMDLSVEDRLIDVVESGKKIKYLRYNSDIDEMEEFNYGVIDKETAKQLIKTHNDPFGYFVVDEYKIISYSESIAGATQMLSDLIDAGIPMSDKDIAAFNAYINDLKLSFVDDYGYEYYPSCPDDQSPYEEYM